MISQRHVRRRLTAFLVCLFLGTSLALAVAQTARSARSAQPAVTITEFTLPTPSSFTNGIAAGPDGYLWFTEQFNNKIWRITPAGTITEFDVLPALPGTDLRDITAGPDGNLWFTDDYNSRIGRITPAGVTTMFVVPTVP